MKAGRLHRLRSMAASIAFGLFVCLTIAVNFGAPNPLGGARIACRWRMFASIARQREVRLRVLTRDNTRSGADDSVRAGYSGWTDFANAREPKLHDNLFRHDFVWDSYARFLCRQHGASADAIQLLAEPSGRPLDRAEVVAVWACETAPGVNP